MNAKVVKFKVRHMCEQADDSFLELMEAMVDANSIPPFLLRYLMEVSEDEIA